ncbi:MAG: efflux RND transporter periplasmic adaptor subunit [Bacteroidota bacterium]
MKIMNFYSALGICILLFMSACGSEEVVQEKVVRPVRYQQVGLGGAANERTFSGSAQTDMVVNLSFRSSGIITEFNMKLGQKVRKGTLLAKLDNVQARLSYESSLASLNSAKSQMNTAKLNLDRIRELYEKGSSSLSDYENAKNGYRTALAGYESAKRSVDIQNEQVKYGYLYAPENGVIASVNAELDENVGAGQLIAVLNAGNTMEIAIGLPETFINKVEKGMKVNIKFAALNGQDFQGRVSEVSPAVNQGTATYPVKVEVLNATSDIKSGMAANVTFDFAEKKLTASNSLIIPAKAVGEDSKGNFVFLVEQQEGSTAIIKKHHIEVGPLTSQGFEVKQGLQEGQKIATAGLQTLLDGQEVTLQ